MDIGTRVWVHEPNDPLVWVAARVHAVHRAAIDAPPTAVTVQLTATGRDVEIALSVAPNGDIRNVLLQNHEHELDPNDLVALPHLHEASILDALRLRYARDAIYTRIGEILISINPFKDLEPLYTRDAVVQYAPEAEALALAPPHLFAIARAAYVDVVRNSRNQSILISGESGAGKTEATKIMMKYFAETCGGAARADTTTTTTTTSIETQVLQSNPILEAFGNARTVRNDNSSRFGKFIELQFDATPRHAIVGARIRTYLLEKIRVINQAPHERNFHVFYELLAAASNASSSIAAAAPAWRLGAANDYCILNQSGCFARRDGVHDAVQFQRTHRAMQQIGLRDDEIVDVFSIVAALLHLGNVAFTERIQSGATREALVTAGNAPFGTAASLLRVTPEALAFAMTKRTLTTATETLTVALDAAQAEHTRNALVMETYRLLFAWLVDKINAQIDCVRPNLDCIGLLDIFGFEDMAVNSFEQLCINYANEALQHQFNAFVFDEEQKLYASEGIAWAFVDFPNNKACLELFEKKPLGLFSLADQECLFPQGTDRALLSKLYTEFEKKTPHPHFAPPAMGWQRQSHFVVAHYAGRVSYAIDGFLAKNKDAFCATAAALLVTSHNTLVQSLSRAAAAADTSAPTKSKSALAAVSVGTQFKLQLSELLDRIRATAPHYVRCIKPNDASVCDAFRAARVLEQLRCGGVLEAVRVARAGFPVRMTHAQFLERYGRILLFRASATSATPMLQRCLARLATLVPSATSSVSLGRTQVFFRREPYEQIERLRIETATVAATRLQTTVRGYQQRYTYRRLRAVVVRLQAHVRGATARVFVLYIRQTKSAIRVQCHVRRWLVRMRYLRVCASALACQSLWRRLVATRHVHALREAKAAQRIATFWRCHHAQRTYNALRRASIALQCAARRRDAKKRLIALRVESRNVAKLQQDNLKLQTELATLRMALLTMQAQSPGHAPFTGFQIPIEPAYASKLQMPRPSMLLQPKSEPSPTQHDDNQPDEQPIEPEVHVTPSTKPRSQLLVDLSCSTDSSVKLQAPQSVLPPLATASFHRRNSQDAAASTTKAEQFTRRRSRSTHLPARLSWQNQQDALDAKVKQLREELKEAARSANPEEEQDQIVKRFVAAQIRQAALASPSPRPRRASSRGSFGLELPEDCDNNSMVDDEEDDELDAMPSVRDIDPQPSKPHFKIRSNSASLVPPRTACAPQSRFAWGTAGQLGAAEPLTLAPLSARPASHTGLSMTRCFFGDPAETSAWSSSVFDGSVSSMGSVPRWCKADQCRECRCKFTFLVRRHHCRSCGNSFCFEHSTRRLLLPELGYADAQRVCDDCFEWRVVEASRAGRPASTSFSLASTARDSDLTV